MGWRLVGLGVEMGGFRDQGWRQVGLAIRKVPRLLDLVFCSEDHLS